MMIRQEAISYILHGIVSALKYLSAASMMQPKDAVASPAWGKSFRLRVAFLAAAPRQMLESALDNRRLAGGKNVRLGKIDNIIL